MEIESKVSEGIDGSITIKEAEKNLLTLLRKEKLCIFAGSGISVAAPSSLPTWDGFIDKYKEICKKICKEKKTKKFDDIISNVNKFKNRDIVGTATALSDIIASFKKAGINMKPYTSEMVDIFANKKSNSYHEAIVKTNYKYILTTNYDDLLEKAARAKGYNELLNRVYSHYDIKEISEAIYKNESAIIHMHGIYTTDIVIDEFIFTKEDYKRIKEKNPGFRTLMNAIFMNYSILLVGYGSSDPHLEDIIDDLNMILKWHGSEDTLELPCYYLLILKDKLSPIFDHNKDKNRTKVIPVDEYDDMLALLKRLQKKQPRKIKK